MIRINLAPMEELENRVWYAGDLVVAAAVALLCYGGLTFYITKKEEAREKLEQETSFFVVQSKRLEPNLNKFKELTKNKKQLEEKIASLEKITVSKIERYKPVILLEHLQNIRPEGLWFSKVTEDSKKETIVVEGNAFDNLVIAEFMSALDSTRYQDPDPTDLRTQVFFKSVSLGIVDSRTQSKNAPKAENVIQTTSGDGESSDDGLERFIKDNPEFARFPSFSLNLQYATRSSKPNAPKLEADSDAKVGAL